MFEGRSRGRTVLALLLGIAAVALAVRFVGLGARVAHQDEARVASWTLHYMAAGAWEYRPIIHGPFLPHVNGVLFSHLGPSDFTMRLPVALVGGLLPLSAWLLRARLRDREVLFVGALFALNPVLIYYSRFMRNDLLLASFAFFAFALVVRYVDTGRQRHLAAAGFAFGLALTTKENALLYPVTWIGAVLLLYDQQLFLARYRDRGLWETAKGRAWSALVGVWKARVGVVAGVGLLVAVFLGFYAPKPGLYQALADPSRLPGVLDAATLGTWEEFADLWGSTDMQEHSTVAFLGHLLTVLAVGGLTTVAFGTLGFVVDRYREAGPRDVVALTFFWALFSLLGYPVVSDIKAGWTAVHVLVPMAVPAAVGLATVLRRAERALRRDQTRVAAVAVLLLVGGGLVTVGSGVAVNAVYPADDRNPVVQYAQPAGDMKPTLAEIEAVAAENEGVDVVFYGEEFYNDGEFDSPATMSIEHGGYDGWFDRLPLPWYLEQYDARVASTTDADVIAETDAPVVIALGEHTGDLDPVLPGYRSVEHQGYLHSRPLVFYLEE